MENLNDNDLTIKVFSFLKDKIKLKILKYNKSIQTKLNISLINCKFFSRRYIKKVEIGLAREYLILGNDLVFEGEYLNKQRNGKGKKYSLFNNKVEFEGEYLNGKRNGKGIEYYNDGKIKFEGEYLNGKKWNGTGYDINNNIIYELKNGNGCVKLISQYSGKLLSEEEYLNGEKKWKSERI